MGPTPLSKLPDMDLAGSVQKLNPHFLMSKRGTTGLYYSNNFTVDKFHALYLKKNEMLLRFDFKSRS